jgi:hypothetical protein
MIGWLTAGGSSPGRIRPSGRALQRTPCFRRLIWVVGRQKSGPRKDVQQDCDTDRLSVKEAFILKLHR